MQRAALIINGSTRANGNTDILVQKIIEGSMSAGVNTRLIELRTKSIANCIGCYQCLKESTCSLNDDMTQVREEIHSARSYLNTGQHRLAVIDVSCALDVICEKKAMEVLELEGRTKADAREKLGLMTSARILKEILVPLVPQEHIDKSGYSSWRDTWRGLRNRVVHDGYPPTAEETAACVDGIRNFCEFIRSLSADGQDTPA